MRRQAALPSAARFLLMLSAGAVLLPISPLRGRANVLPESLMMLHVQPVSGSCETSVVLCDEVVRTTTATGPLEFLLFFQPVAWQHSGEAVTIGQLHADLIWPQSWRFIAFDPCYGDGWLNEGGTVHQLDMSWWNCPQLPMDHHAVFLVARIVLDVDGPGRLEFEEGGWDPVELGCPGPVTITYAAGAFAEAGMGCEYTACDCYEPMCTPEFYQPVLELTAPFGRSVQDSVRFYAEGCYPAGLTVDTQADWATATIEGFDYTNAWLVVTADAAALMPGMYETSIQVETYCKARCLDVVFTVTGDPMDVEDAPRIQRTRWGRIKATYR